MNNITFNQVTRKKCSKNTLGFIVSWILFSMLFTSVSADDTEIFFSKSKVNSNVLFIMDNSFSMTEEVPNTDASGTVETLSFQITHGLDDAEEFIHHKSSEEKARRYSSDIGLTVDRASDSLEERSKTNNTFPQRVGLRFRNIEIPKNAVITSAHIQFTADKEPIDASSDDADLVIKVQNHGNPPTFGNTKHNIKNRSLYSEAVDWSVPAWNTANEQGSAQKTPNLKTLVQRAVNHNNWAKGHAIVFVITGSGTRSANAYNGDKGTAPSLIIGYEKEGGLKTRMQVMQEALKSVLDNAPANLSVGIMNYGGNSLIGPRGDKPNGIRFPVTGIKEDAKPIIEAAITVNGSADWLLSNIPVPSIGTNDAGEEVPATVGTFLSEISDTWTAQGATPIVDALYEAARYYRGDALLWGRGSVYESFSAHPASYVHPAPNAVLPYIASESIEACGAVGIHEVGYYEGETNTISRFDSGNTGGVKCPVDPNNPTGPGSEANCPVTKYKSGNYKKCTERKPATYHPDVCKWVDGKEICTRGGKKTNSECLKSKMYYYARYKKCEVKPTPIAAPSYVSPIVSDCQSNNIILMSDGKPEYLFNQRPHSYSKIKRLIGGNCQEHADNQTISPFGYKAGECGAELTEYLSKNDLNTSIDGVQTLNTFVVGFADGIDANAESYLKSLVTVDDDKTPNKLEGYYSASNGEELAAAFSETLRAIAQEARSQASPGYSVNVRSGLEHEDEIYIPVFDKNNTSVWSGNLKKFKLKEVAGHRHIRGKKNATDATISDLDAMTELGLFTEHAWDFWSNSSSADGNVVEDGGTASLLTDPEGRKLYSNITSNTNLTAAGNQIKRSNAKLTAAMLFDGSTLEASNSTIIANHRKKLINFIRGWKKGQYDATKTLGSRGIARKHMGDMLHSEPVIISYHKGSDTVAKQQYIFAATNEGYLHVFDAATGAEKFAFMPKELLTNIENQYTGEGEHQYGIDGSMTYFHDDKNKDGIVNGTGANKDKVYLYFGMRRGGRSYYALDVSDIATPKILWRVDNTTQNTSSANIPENFSRLGQSWSMPYIASVMHNGNKKRVVVFTAGHEEHLDYGKNRAYSEISVQTDRKTQDMGDDIYIVDAEDGSKILWSLRAALGTTGNNVVEHGLAGGLRMLDVNGNGLLDRLYFADTGGNVWRLDLSETLSIDDNASKLTKLASLSTDGGANARKFYNEPDVASISDNGKKIFSVSVGSGLRPHPMNRYIDDYMFVLLDKSPLKRSGADYEPIELDDLAKVEVGVTSSETIVNGKIKAQLTKSVSQEGFDNKRITQTNKKGWYVKFNGRGEKVLAASTTFEGSIVFTTLVPEVSTQIHDDPCLAPGIQGRIYAFNILTGEPSADLHRDGDVNDQDVFETISSNEIPGTPQLIFNKLKCENGACKHEVDVRIGKKSTEVDTSNLSEVESIYWSDPVNN